ncbi:carboxymuconolactone decarboxylase family protein [Nocardioides sp. B-3]|uniref:carboxymuconolactone decarboxylase family protein n=1 Tax=Nocardioides sp. B-3 TaxID=2895565 RepID=UPI002152908B|nr:carboxymuconolactone decarboxylase family protein [Nocardioides sp. B-3]UUZ61153.1 carboxymuconolactone decarboxylase family protein [Nocardioides sp. B-3]
MTSTTRVPPAEITGLYGGLLKIAMKKLLGGVPAGAGVMWHHRAVFNDSMKLGRKSEKWHELDPNLTSFATMAAAAEIGCSFCLDLGYFQSHNKGPDEAKAREVPRWRESDVFTPLATASQPERERHERAPSRSASSPARPSTSCARWHDVVRSTSDRGCPSRC